MDKITKEGMNELRKDIDLALQAVAQKHGLKKLHAATGKFDPDNNYFSFSLEGVLGNGLDKEAAYYVLAAKLYNWPALGSEFDHKGSTYKIIGCNKTCTKIHCQTGEKVYAFDDAFVKVLTNNQKKG